MKDLNNFILEKLKINKETVNNSDNTEFEILLAEANELLSSLSKKEISISCANTVDDTTDGIYPIYANNQGKKFIVKFIQFVKNSEYAYFHIQSTGSKNGRYSTVACSSNEDIMEYVGKNNFIKFYRTIINHFKNY